MFPDPVPPRSREDDRAPVAPGRRVLRLVRRGRHAQHGRGAASARAVRRAPRTPHRPRRGHQATGARGRPGHARSGEPARSHVHHAARSRGHPPARVRFGRRDGRDRRHRPPLSDLSPGPAPQGVKVLTEVIQRMVGVLAEAVGRLKKGDDVMKYCIEAKKLEEEGDAIYQEALGHMFETERDALEIIKWKEIYDNLETTLDQGEDVANVLESITIKHA